MSNEVPPRSLAPIDQLPMPKEVETCSKCHPGLHTAGANGCEGCPAAPYCPQGTAPETSVCREAVMALVDISQRLDNVADILSRGVGRGDPRSVAETVETGKDQEKADSKADAVGEGRPSTES